MFTKRADPAGANLGDKAVVGSPEKVGTTKIEVQREIITIKNYSWCDGKKVSVYIDQAGISETPDVIETNFTEDSAELILHLE
eukprot:gene6680-2603_t